MKRRGGNKQNPWRPAKWDERAGRRDQSARLQDERARARDELRERDERAHDERGEHGRERGEQARQFHAERRRGEHARESPGERVARAFSSGGGRELKERRPANVSRPQAGGTHDSDGGAQVFGVQPVLEALRAGARPVERVTVAAGSHESRLREIIELARESGVPVRRAPRADLHRLAAGANHQGVVATIAAARYTPAEELLDALAARVGTPEPPLAVVLDGIADPRNLGAILRTVECAGAHGVFVPERRASGLTETVAKAAAGALEYVPVARAANVVRLIADLKGRGIWTVGTASDAVTSYTEWDWAQPCALLLGGEGEGLRRLVRGRCDALVSIPLRGHIESLNVSVAAGIILYEAVRQRTARRPEAYSENQVMGDG
jgi:23S rRNA (guanosine2251-2'-O)-methyltransferase